MQGGLLRYRRQAFLAGLAVLLAMALSGLPAMKSLEHGEQRFRFALTPTDDDFNSVVVAIDTASLRAIPDWPWSRDHYADLLDRLNEAGAAAVAFDIDFSTPRDGDQAFAEAIRRSDAPVYLTAHRQAYQGMPGVMAEIRPNAELRNHATLASTMFPVEKNGLVRILPPFEYFSDGPLPQLAVQLSGRDIRHPHGIDFAQDMSALPVISFSKALHAADIEGKVEGRVVFVGATAFELGDEFALPSLGLQSGVLLNALAYETLRKHNEKHTAPLILVLILVMIASAAASLPLTAMGVGRYVLINAGVFFAIFALGYVAQWAFDLFIFTLLPLATHLIGIAIMLAVAADAYALQIFRSRMDTEKYARVLKSMMRSNNDGILMTDRDGRIAMLNGCAAGFPGSQQAGVAGTAACRRRPASGRGRARPHRATGASRPQGRALHRSGRHPCDPADGPFPL